MSHSSVFLLTIGGILLLGLIISTLASRTFLPRVTLLLIFGIIIGKESLNLIPELFTHRFDIISDMTLLMVGFLLGGKLTASSLQQQKKEILWISVVAALFTTLVVTLFMVWAGLETQLAILLGCIAAATAPAAILDVTAEAHSRSRFSTLLLSIVAIDDVWALMLFAMGIALVGTMNGHSVDSPFIHISKDVGGAVVLGLLIGLPAAYLTGRIRPGQPVLTEAIGLVFICGGLAMWLEVSHLIASIVMGAVISNLARHHEYPFHAIEGIEWPFMVIFFTLAGASLDLSVLKGIGLVGSLYVIARVLGKYLGARLGSQLAGSDKATSQWLGIALLPQAGVPIGMALVASNHFPEYRQMLLSLVIGSTVFFDIIGPIFTRMALQRVEREQPES